MLIYFEPLTNVVLGYNDVMSESEQKSEHDNHPNCTYIVDKLPQKPDDNFDYNLLFDVANSNLFWQKIESEVMIDNDVVLLELLNATEYNTCLLEMQMDA